MRYTAGKKAILIAALCAVLLLALAGGAAASSVETNPAQLNDFFWRCVNFAVLAVVLFILLKKPLKSAMGNRTEGIRQELEDLKAKRDQAAKDLADMEGRLKEMQGERDQILADFRAQGEREKQKIVESAQALSERIKAQAQFTIEQETAQAKAELKAEISAMSASVAEDLLKQNITAEDQTRLVDEYLAKVEQEVV